MFETMNGRAVSWSELEATANIGGGIPLIQPDLKSCDHESKVDRGEKRGASGGRVVARTTGAVSNSASATWYRAGLRDFKKALSNAAVSAGHVNSDGHVQLSKVPFDLVITHSYEDDPEIYVVKLLGCHLDKDSGKHAEGTDAETIDVDLNPLRIVEIVNGIDTVLL
jgi:hypothetical protein